MQKQIQNDERQAEIERLQLKLQQNKQDLRNLLAIQKKALSEKKVTLELKNQALINKQNELTARKISVIENKSLDEATKQAELAALDAEFADDIATLTAEKVQAEDDYNAAAAEVARTEQDIATYDSDRLKLMTLRNEQAKAEITNTSILGKVINGLLSPLMLVFNITTAIMSLMKIINLLHKEENMTLMQTIKLKMKDFVSSLQAAGAKMAESAASIPVAGWVIAAAILAAVGIAIGVSAAAANGAFKNTSNKIESTEENLNQLQADLYNLNSGINNVKALGNEFEELSNKIIKTEEDLSRLNEIATQINDDAGYEVVNTTLSEEEQLAQIRGYQQTQENKAAKQTAKINKELGQGLKDVGSSKRAREKYVQQMTTGSAGRNAIRTLGMSYIDGIKEVDSETKDALLNILTDQFDTVLTKSGIDFTKFGEMLGNNFVTELDKAMQSDTLTEKLQFFANLETAQKELLTTSVPIFNAIANMSEKTAAAFDSIGYSQDEINTL